MKECSETGALFFFSRVLFNTVDHIRLVIGLNKLTRVGASRTSIEDVCKLLIDKSWNGSLIEDVNPEEAVYVKSYK